MRLKQIAALVLAAVLCLPLAACKMGGEPGGEVSSSSQPVKEVDPNWPAEVGDVKLESQPESVISLSPALTELVFELGAGEQLTGVSIYCDYPAEVDGLPRCGTAALPDREAIEQLKPALVLASVPLTQQDTIWMQQQNIAVLVLPRVDSIDALEERYLAAGTLLGGKKDGEAGARAVFAPLRATYDAVEQAAKTVEKPLSGLWLRAVPLMAATGETFEGKLLETLGVTNDAAEFTGWEYPADKAVDLYPDVVFYDQSIDPEYFKGTKVYSTTDAFKQNRMYPFDALVFERQSGRMFDELARMFETVHPDVPLTRATEPASGGESEPAESEAASEEESGSLSGVVEEPKD